MSIGFSPQGPREQLSTDTQDGLQRAGEQATNAAHVAATAAHGATGAVVGTTNAQVLTNKTLTAPTIGDFTNAQHDHLDADDGGTLSAAAIASGLLGGERVAAGYLPFAYGLGLAGDAVTTTARNLAAAGGATLLPIEIAAPMLVESISIYNTDTASARSWEWRLFAEPAGGGATLNHIAGLNGTDAFTPGSAGIRTVAATTPTLIGPGLYWVAVRNTHATNQFGIGRAAVGTFTGNNGRTKTLGSALTTTLDGSTGWTGVAGLAGVRLNGRVVAEGSAF